MTSSQAAGLDKFLDGRRQRQQAQRVGHVASALADRVCDCLLRMGEILRQPPIGPRLVERRQVRSLQVLDQRKLERLLVGKLAHDRRHLVQACELGGAPPALAGDDLVSRSSARSGSYQQRLQDAALADRFSQRLEFGLVKSPPRLKRRRAEKLDRDVPACRRRLLRGVRIRASAQEGRQSHTQAAPPRAVALGGHAATSRRSRRSISPARCA